MMVHLIFRAPEIVACAHMYAKVYLAVYICLSPSINTFTLYTESFLFSVENNCNIIYKLEQLLIHLARLTAKEEKITQYDMNTHETVII